MAKNLIVYFSRDGKNYVNGSIQDLAVGNTEIVAKKIKELTGGDLLRINPVKKYHAEYDICIEEAKRDLQSGARPEYEPVSLNLSEYDTMYLGYPNY